MQGDWSIKAAAGRGVVWNSLSALIGPVLRLITQAIVARLLGPQNFGLIGIALMVANTGIVLQDMGFTLAIIQHSEVEEPATSTMFWLNMLLSGLFCGAILSFTPAAAELFGLDELQPILLVLSPLVVLRSLGNVHNSLLQRALDFRSISLSEVLALIAETVVTLSLLAMGQGVWALVMGVLVRESARVGALWTFSDWRPLWQLRLASIRPLLGFSLNSFGTKSMLYFRLYFDSVVIGRVLGAASFGLYSLAFQVAMIPRFRLVPIVRRIMLPLLARFQDEPRRLRAAYVRLLAVVGLGVLPVSVGTFVIADDLVRLVYGEDWLEMVIPLRVLCIGALAVPVASTAANLLLAVGRAELDRQLTWLSALLFGLLVVVGAKWGILGVAVGVGVELWLFALGQAWVTRRAIGFSFFEYTRALWPASVSCVLMAVAVSAWRVGAGHLDLPIGFRAGAAVMLGTIVYVVAVHHLAQALLVEVLELAEESLPSSLVSSRLWNWVRRQFVATRSLP